MPTPIYRQIYEQHYGPIPKDEYGKSFHIHHIDGNRSNNDPKNLVALSEKDHYNIHYTQGDYAACGILASRMDIPFEEMSELSKKAREKEKEQGTLYWSSDKHRDWARKRAYVMMEQGNNSFYDSEKNREHRLREVSEGRHNSQNVEVNRVRSEKQKQKVLLGEHHLLGGEIQRKSAYKRLSNNNHPSQIKTKCPHCGKSVDIGNYKRWHGDKCKWKK
jgi:HNH endonuclease